MNAILPILARPEQLFIGGSWTDPATDARIELISPSSEERLGRVAAASEADADRAVAAARRAFDKGPWPRMSGAERAAKIRAVADRMTARSEDFARAWSLQVGMPFAHSRAVAGYFRGYFDYYAGLADQGFEELRTPAQGGSCAVVREAVGVVLAIVPWNAPLATLLLKVAPALAAGCTVIAKPSPETPIEAMLLAECIAEVGLPEGVFSVLPADRDVSEYLVRHNQIDKVSFTGSTAAGLRIASLLGGRMARYTMELGGKSAAIILDDARTETVVAGIMPNLIGLCGQQCAAFSRILVPRARRDEITEALSAAFASVKVGDAFDVETQMGPIVSQRQLERVRGYIARGTADGARIVTGGARPAHLDKGWFIEPTLFTDVTNDMVIAREEIFGPVGSIITYDDDEQAIAIANDSDYGLSGGVFTEDTDRAYAMARRIRTGNIAQNGRVIDFTLPYGGYKLSGVGREGGVEGLHGFTEVKTIFTPAPPSHLAAG
jgi:acyl-CoA reductase-like NAD-dependent aldehyde dehydrogenase